MSHPNQPADPAAQSMATGSVARMPSPASDAIRQIPTKDIAPDPDQPRKHFDPIEMQALAASIRDMNVLQPILVRPLNTAMPDNAADVRPFRIIAGERRWRACYMAGVATIPAIVRSDLDEMGKAMAALAENLLRTDLNPLEVAHALSLAIEEHGLTHTQLAEYTGMDRTRVTKTLSLLQLPASLRTHLIAGTLSQGHAETLAALATPLAASLGERAAIEGWSLKRLRMEIELARKPKGRQPTRTARDPNIRALEERLSEVVGSPVSFEPAARGKGGRLVIRYASNDILQGVLERHFGYRTEE